MSDVRAYGAGLHHDARGAVVGAWFLDARDALGAGAGEAPHDAVTWSVTRSGPELEVSRTRTRGALGPHDKPVKRRTATMQRFLRFVAHARARLEATRPDLAAPSVARPRPTPHAACPLSEDGTAEDLRAALDGVEPFLRTLDRDAVGMVLDGYLDRDADGVYPLLDRTFHERPPLVVALWHEPHWRHAFAWLAERRRGDLCAAAASGRDGIRALLDDRLRSYLHGGAASQPAATRAAAEIEALGPFGSARVRATVDGIVRTPIDPAAYLAGHLSALPPSWWPRGADQWDACAACGPALHHAMAEARREHVAALLDVKGNWVAYLRRLTAAHGGGPRDLTRACRDLRDFEGAYATQVLGPAVRIAGNTRDARERASGVVAKRLLTDGRRLCRVLDASRRWHSARARMTAAMSTGPVPGVPDGWPRAWPTARYGDVEVRELTDAAALAAEGGRGPDARGTVGLDHCVAGHASPCLSGRSRVLSVMSHRDGVEVRLSTAEVRPGPDAVLQHSGPRNSEPPPEAHAALDAYLADVASGLLAVDAVALAPVPGWDGSTARAGYDHDVPGAWERARDLWDPFVPRRLRGLSAQRLVAVMAACDRGRWRPVAPPMPPDDGATRGDVQDS